MKLHEAVRQLVNQFGKEIVCETRLANLVADFNGFDGRPALKRAFNGMLKAGYGKTLYEESINNPANVNPISSKLAHSYAQEFEIKKDLVVYCFDAIIYGLGLVDKINEPMSKGLAPISETGDILVDLDKSLTSLQHQYLDLLNTSVTLPKDILKDPPGFYTTEALTALYELEYKISAIQQQLNRDDGDWCKKTRELKLQTHRKIKNEAVEGFLSELKTKYLNTLESYTIIPKILFVKCSGIVSDDGEENLNLIEKEIRVAYYNLGVPYDDWCGNARAFHIRSYRISRGTHIKRLFYLVVVIFVLGSGIAYLASLNSIRAFETQIQMGAQRSSESQYAEAIKIFASAKESYDGSFKIIYQHTADSYINENVDKALNICSNMIENGELLQAANLLTSLPDSIINEIHDNKEKLDNEKLEFEKAIDKWVDVLIQNIADNKGHLDMDLARELDSMANVLPDHYWLNLIKSKQR